MHSRVASASSPKLLLIDEQQRLLVDVHIEAGNSEETAIQMANSQQLVTERKQQRQRLLAKRNKINEERENQLVEKKEVLSMLEQLLTLDSGLVIFFVSAVCENHPLYCRVNSTFAIVDYS